MNFEVGLDSRCNTGRWQSIALLYIRRVFPFMASAGLLGDLLRESGDVYVWRLTAIVGYCRLSCDSVSFAVTLAKTGSSN